MTDRHHFRNEKRFNEWSNAYDTRPRSDTLKNDQRRSSRLCPRKTGRQIGERLLSHRAWFQSPGTCRSTAIRRNMIRSPNEDDWRKYLHIGIAGVGYSTEDISPVRNMQQVIGNANWSNLHSPLLNWYYSHVQIQPLWQDDKVLSFRPKLPLIDQYAYLRYHILTKIDYSW